MLVSLSVVFVKSFTDESAWLVLGSVTLGTVASLLLNKVIQKLSIKHKELKIDLVAPSDEGSSKR